MNNILNLFKPSQPIPTSTIQSVALVPDRPSLTYNSGELVSGHCIISVNGSLDISQIEIKLSGKAKVVIPVTTSAKDHARHQQQHQIGQLGTSSTTTTTTVNGQVTTLVKKEASILKLVYNPATVYNSALTTGRHDIGFSFLIPPNVPSSMEHQLGSIKYKLKVKVCGSDVKNAELNLNVLSSPAVSPAELYAPISLTNEKTVGLIGGKRVVLRCEVPHTGFTLGMPIPITCHISNLSKKHMILKASLKQEMTFKGDVQHTRTVTNKLTEATGPQIGPKGDCTHSITLQVPINLPIVHNTCPIITIKYFASVKLDIPGSFDLACKMPVLLTNLPLNFQQPQLPQQPMQPMPPHQTYVPPSLSMPAQ